MNNIEDISNRYNDDFLSMASVAKSIREIFGQYLKRKFETSDSYSFKLPIKREKKRGVYVPGYNKEEFFYACKCGYIQKKLIELNFMDEPIQIKPVEKIEKQKEIDTNWQPEHDNDEYSKWLIDNQYQFESKKKIYVTESQLKNMLKHLF